MIGAGCGRALSNRPALQLRRTYTALDCGSKAAAFWPIRMFHALSFPHTQSGSFASLRGRTPKALVLRETHALRRGAGQARSTAFPTLDNVMDPETIGVGCGVVTIHLLAPQTDGLADARRPLFGDRRDACPTVVTPQSRP